MTARYEQFADAQRAAADVVHHRRVGLGAEPVRQDAPLRRLDDAVLVAERPLAREGQPDQPVQQDRVGGADHLLQGAQLRDARRGDGDPVLGCQVVVGGDQPDLGGVARDGGQRRPQVAPRRCRADVGEVRARRRACSSAACWSVAHCTWTSSWSNRPAADTTSSGEDAQSGGQPVPRRTQLRRLLHAGPPAAHHRGAGRVEAVRQPGARAVDARGGDGAALGPASLLVTTPSLSVKLPPPGGSITGSAETSAGIPLAVKPSAVVAPSASPAGRRSASAARRSGRARPGRRRPARRSCRSAPAGSTGPTDQAGHWSVIPRVSDSDFEDDQQPRHDGQRRADDRRPPPPGAGAAVVAAGEVEPGGEQQGQDGQPQQDGGEPEVPLRGTGSTTARRSWRRTTSR